MTIAPQSGRGEQIGESNDHDTPVRTNGNVPVTAPVNATTAGFQSGRRPDLEPATTGTVSSVPSGSMRDSQPKSASLGSPLALAKKTSSEPPAIRLMKFVFDYHVASDLVPDDTTPPEKWKAIGPQGVTLLLAVVAVEDKTRFARVVKFANADLAAQTGISERDLKRVRQRLIATGWLWYQAGAKGRAGLYRVLIPANYRQEFDGVVDPRGDGWLCTPEQAAEADVRSQSGQGSDTLLRTDAGQNQAILAPNHPDAVPDAGQNQDTLAHIHTSTCKPLNSYKPSPPTTEATNGESEREPVASDQFRSAAPRSTPSPGSADNTPISPPRAANAKSPPPVPTPWMTGQVDDDAVNDVVAVWNSEANLPAAQKRQLGAAVKVALTAMYYDEVWGQHWRAVVAKAATIPYWAGGVGRKSGRLTLSQFANSEKDRQLILDYVPGATRSEAASETPLERARRLRAEMDAGETPAEKAKRLRAEMETDRVEKAKRLRAEMEAGHEQGGDM